MKPSHAFYQLTAAQKQLLAGQLLATDKPLCNMALACTINGFVDVDTMQLAWQQVASSCDALGMRVVIDDDKITQSTGHAWPELHVVDCSEQSQPQQYAETLMQQKVETAIQPESVLGHVVLLKLTAKRWIFFCNLHHMICDATSFASVWQDLALAYDAAAGSTTDFATNATPSSVQRADEHINERADFLTFVEATVDAQQNRLMAQSDYISQLQYIAPPAPFGRRPGRTDTASTRVSQVLSDERMAALTRLAALPQARGFGKGIGHCSVLLTILTALLYRIGGGSTQTIGLPLPQRKSLGLEKTVGLFVEVLPIQVSIDDDTNFLTLVEQVRAAFLGVLKEGEAGDCALLEAHSIPAILNYINAPMGNFGHWPTQIKWLHSGHIDSQHQIRLQVEDWMGDGSVTLSFDFNDAVFNSAQRAQTIDAFWSLFDAMATNCAQSINAVSIADTRVLVDPAQVANDHTNPCTVFHRMSQHLSTLGNRPALMQANQSVSYAELDRRVHSSVVHLNNAGVDHASRVAVLLPRDIRLPQVLVCIHACGACYVPIDSNQPVARIRDILSDCCPALLISTPALVRELSFDNILMVDDLFNAAHVGVETEPFNGGLTESESASMPGPSLADVAYIMYTSGSTGKPKGVTITHKALANYAHWASGFYADDNPVDMALFTPIGFDLTVTSVFLPLITGGTLHIYDESSYSTIEALGAVLDDDVVDIIKLTPAHLSTLVPEQCSQTKRLKQFIVGGEDLPVTLAGRIHKAFDAKVRIHNEYGPTEATVGCVLHTYNPETNVNGSVPIGLPIASSHVRVLNSAGQDQLPGCSGELYVGGPSLAEGYWGQESMTRAQFHNLMPNSDRYYRTGDLVREGLDGTLQYQGRVNEQFKLRGHRIEPAEIESAALQHPSITTCVAVLTSIQTATESTDKKCIHCGLSSHVPGAMLDASGACKPCRNYALYKERVEAYFRPMQELQDKITQLKVTQQSKYDCIMLLSGGKDSSYALAQLVDMGLCVLALTLDNGFISQSAKDNVDRVCAELGVEHRYASTPSMNAIFLDSLQRHANVCNGCFKTIYTLALQLACELGINCIVTGLSRGQFFETRLSEDWFTAPDYNAEAMDEAIVAARKSYHRMEDAVSCAFDTEFLKDDDVFDRVQIFDFYRYCDVSLDQMYEYLDSRLHWIRPTDTGRSTNCLINDAGIYVHRYERGFHNYANPYSWDVRLGHKVRDAALQELDDEIDEPLVQSQLAQIGYQLSDKDPEQIALYYVSHTEISDSELKHWLATRLPEWMVPVWLTELPSLPLSSNGKIDRRLLPVPMARSTTMPMNGVPRALTDGKAEVNYRSEQLPPQSDEEKLLARIWCRHLRLDTVGVNENFFALGGESLMAIRIISELNHAGYPYKPADLFDYQTIAQLAQVILTDREQLKPVSSAQQSESQDEKPVAFKRLSKSQLDALSRVINKSQPQ